MVGDLECPWDQADSHRLAAAPTQHGSSDLGCGGRDDDVRHQLHAFEQDLAAVVGEAVVATAPKAAWQQVAEQQPEEVGAGQAAGLQRSGFCVAVAKTHVAVVGVEDVVFAQHAAVEVAGQIAERFVAITHTDAVRHPSFGQVGWQFQTQLAHPLQQLGAKHGPQLAAVEQAASLAFPAPGLRVHPAAGHHQMHMRMEVACAAVGVQDGGGTQIDAAAVVSELGQGLPRALHQRGKDVARMAAR